MLSFKKSMLAVLAVSSSAAFAGTMGPVCSPTAVTVPCETCAWDFGGRALYFQTSSSAYLAESTIRGTQGSFTRNLNPNWNWGFQLEASYHFGKGKDINVNWYRLRGSNNRYLQGPINLGTVNYPDFATDMTPTIQIQNARVDSLNQSRNFAWDMVNVEMAQHIDFDEHTWGRLHVGVDYSRVADNASTIWRFSGSPTSEGGDQIAGIADQDTYVNGSYNGFGPRVGTDLGYNTECGLGIYGGGAVGLLAGTSKVGYTTVSKNLNDLNSGLNIVPASTSLNYNVNRVVAEVDARLGLKYGYQMANGDLSLDAGWMWVNYLSPLASYTAENAGTISHNFATQGVYFGAKWLGNFA